MNSFNKEDWRFDSLPTSCTSFDPDASIFKLVSITVAPYYRNYHCRLCGHSAEEAFTEDEMNRHCMDPRHSSRVQLLLDEKQEISYWTFHRLRLAEKEAPRVSRLGLPAWQHEIQSFFYQWVRNVGTTAPNTAFTKALSLLIKYERMELSSLIELAAWKHSCLMASTPESSRMTSYLGMKEWESDGWKKNKAAMRRSEAIQVIVPNVLAFIYAEYALAH